MSLCEMVLVDSDTCDGVIYNAVVAFRVRVRRRRRRGRVAYLR